MHVTNFMHQFLCSILWVRRPQVGHQPRPVSVHGTEIMKAVTSLPFSTAGDILNGHNPIQFTLFCCLVKVIFFSLRSSLTPADSTNQRCCFPTVISRVLAPKRFYLLLISRLGPLNSPDRSSRGEEEERSTNMDCCETLSWSRPIWKHPLPGDARRGCCGARGLAVEAPCHAPPWWFCVFPQLSSVWSNGVTCSWWALWRVR